MAFKATRKPVTKKVADDDVAIDVPAKEVLPLRQGISEASIDDVIGAPKEAVHDEPVASVVASKPVETAVFVSPPVSPSLGGPAPQTEARSPASEQGQYQSQTRPSYERRDRPQGYAPRYGNNNNNGGGYRNDHRPGGYSRPPMMSHQSSGYRRDGGYANPDSAFSQDVNVPTETVRGILDIMPEGHGFLRPKFTPSEKDIYISQSQIRRFLLRNGDMVQGQARQPKESERYWGLLKVELVNEMAADQIEKRPKFEDLVPVYPNKLLILETGKLPLSTRIIDLVAPIGFGQRGLIVSPPKAGKTTILKELAAGIIANHPNVHLMAALIGERPEEVTDITRNVKGEVFASNFDESPSEQTRIAEVALDRAKRLVEMGKDVVVLLDSITRLARAYNLVVNPSGRTLSGGFDPAALYPAKRFLGAARCVEPFSPTGGEIPVQTETTRTGGSLTVIGTALVDTGSRMDDLIYEEFKGTGNMELHLSRILQERRIFPAIDIGKSGTRHDELLLGEEAMKKVTTLRHMLSLLGDEERTMMLIDRLSKVETNVEFLESLSKGA
jgi:transcription termination factor Rho